MNSASSVVGRVAHLLVEIKLAHLMKEEHGYGLEVMRKIKRALDPNGIMNPGKSALTSTEALDS